MFSQRTRWDRRPNLLSSALSERREKGLPVLDLRQSNPSQVGLGWDECVLTDLLAQPGAGTFRPEAAGSLEARECLSAWYATQGVDVPAENLVLTASTSEAYSYLFKLLCDPGDVVLTPRPGYPLFEYLTGLESVETLTYELRHDKEWELDVDALAARLPERARAVLTVQPGNPDGCVLAEENARRLVELCRHAGLALISDEVFAPYPWSEEKPLSGLLGLSDSVGTPCFALSGLSKLAGLPQLKLAWIALSGPRAFVNEARSRLEWISDTYLSCNSPVQLALPQLLDASASFRGRLLTRLRQNLATLGTALKGTELELLPAQGGWAAMIRLPEGLDDADFSLRLLDEQATLVQPGYFFDVPNMSCVVLSLITPETDFEEGLRRLLKATS